MTPKTILPTLAEFWKQLISLDKFSRIPGAELAYSNPTVDIYRVASASMRLETSGGP